ncbi:MAG: GNAT family N-acetyltransferase [Haloferacaceae archaeon]
MDLTVRRARADDRERVAAFTAETWADRDVDDYVADAFPAWVESDGPDQHTWVAEADGVVSGVIQASVLTPHEGWLAGLRVAPTYRGEGVGVRLTNAGLDWLRGRGAAVARNMVFSWNVPSLGLSRRTGFRPCTEFRFAHPDPDEGAEPALTVGARPDAGWAFWTGSDARTALAGLALDGGRAWALSELTRADVVAAADDGRLLTVHGGGTRGLALRIRSYDREVEGDGEDAARGTADDAHGGGDRATGPVTWAEYGVGAWADREAARALCRAVARDAARAGADRTRLLLPEGVRWASDAAAARVALADAPDFVLAADLSDPGVGSDDREAQGT